MKKNAVLEKVGAKLRVLGEKLKKVNKTKLCINGAFLLLALLITFIIIFPFIWMLPASLKGKTDIWSVPPQWFPTEAVWDNFAALFQPDINGGYFFKSFLVTFFEATVATLLNLAINMLAAYGFARHEFWGKKAIWMAFLFTMFVPGITVQITSIQVVTALGLTNTLLVLILPTAANAYNIFFFRQFFLMIPDCVEEAATIDGASRIQIFFRIIFPLSVTPMVVTGVGCFIGHWNSYIWPTLTIVENQENLRQVMQFVYMLSNSEPRDYGKVVAATVIAIACPLILFSFFQKKIVEGISVSGLK